MAVGHGRAAIRIPWVLLLSLFMYVLLLAGMYWVDRYTWYSYDLHVESIVGFGFFVATCLGIGQLPLWISARFFGWRLAWGADADGRPSPVKWQFRIKHMLIAMTLLAVVFSVWNWGLREAIPLSNQIIRWAVLSVLHTLLTFNPLVALPWVWGAFQPRTRLVLLALAWVPTLAIIIVVQHRLLLFFYGGFWPEATLVLSLINIFQCLTVAGVLLLLRGAGYRLVRTIAATSDSIPSCDSEEGRRKRDIGERHIVLF